MANTYRAFLTKMGGTDPADYIGKAGEIFWNPTTGALRLSDGVTPGGQDIAGGGGVSGEVNQDAFSIISVSGQSDIEAEAKTDTLTFVAGNNVTIETDAGTDSITISSSGGGGGGGGDANQNAFSNIAVSGQTTIEADSTTDTLTIAAGDNITITTDDGTDTVTISGDEGLATRNDTTTETSSSLADAATDSSIDITGFKSYGLYSITANNACWVRIYDSNASRTADINAGRTQGVDPAPNAGVIAEAVFTQSGTVKFTPGVFGFNDESTPTTNIPVAVTNNSGGTTTIDITLRLIQLEG